MSYLSLIISNSLAPSIKYKNRINSFLNLKKFKKQHDINRTSKQILILPMLDDQSKLI